MGVTLKPTGLPPARPRVAVARHELVAVALTIAAILIVTGLPYVVASATAPGDRQFMGVVLNVPDTTQYFSWARESGQAILIENKLTPERWRPEYLNIFWLAVGRLALGLNISIPDATQIMRLVAGAVYLGAISWFVTLVAHDRLERWVAFLVAALGGGLGWLLVLAKQVSGELPFPNALYVMEANAFLTVLAFPHQAMAGGLLILILGLAAVALERGSLPLAGAAGLIALALGLQHGYDLLIVYAVVGSTALVLTFQGGGRLRPLGLAIVMCAPSLPAALYFAFITRTSPIWHGVLAQYGNAGIYTPPVLLLLVLMGVPLVVLIVTRGGDIARATNEPREILLRLWLVIGFLLLYIPTDFQIKMLAAWQVPVALLATRVVVRGTLSLPRWRAPGTRAGRLLLPLLLVLAVLPTNLYLYAWRYVDLGRQDYPYYLHREEVAALQWLDRHAAPSDTVLSSLTIGQYVPGTTGTRAFLAHWAQTLAFFEKRALVERFFDPATTEAERARILDQFGVRYLFVGRPERALGGYDPDSSPHLMRVYANATAAIYERRAARGTSEEPRP